MLLHHQQTVLECIYGIHNNSLPYFTYSLKYGKWCRIFTVGVFQVLDYNTFHVLLCHYLQVAVGFEAWGGNGVSPFPPSFETWWPNNIKEIPNTKGLLWTIKLGSVPFASIAEVQWTRNLYLLQTRIPNKALIILSSSPGPLKPLHCSACKEV